MISDLDLKQQGWYSSFMEREHIRPLHRRYSTLIILILSIILLTVIFMPPIGPLTPFQEIMGILILLLSLSWTALTLSDNTKPRWLQWTASVLILGEVVFTLYAYSGAKFGELGHIFFNQRVMSGQWPLMFDGLLTTIRIAGFTIFFSTILGLFLAVLRAINNKMLSAVIIVYLNFFRTMPAIVVLMFVYFGLPSMNIKLSAFVSCVLVLTLTGGAYVSEIFRAGIEAIHHTQLEASRALGLSFGQTMGLVVLPQAFRIVMPPMTNQWIGTLKDTAICSMISITELLKAGQIVSTWKANPTPLIAAAGIYLAMILPLTRLANYLEYRMKKR